MVVFILASMWFLSYALAKWKIAPESELFAILLLLVTALAGGRLVKILRLPPLLGMLVIGLVWRNWNVTAVDVAGQISTPWAVFLRNLATVVILLRGGYGLNHVTLRDNWPAVASLGLAPGIFESIAWAVGAHFLLNMGWLWGFLTG